MTRFFFAILLFGAFASAQQYPGAYSRNATSIWGAVKPLAVASPDGTKSVVIEHPDGEATHAVSVQTSGHTYKTPIGAWVNAELAWSPDSRAFFVTYSTGGNIGTYHVKLFYVGREGIRTVEPVPNGRKLFTPKCSDPEYPNVAAIEWLGGSERLAIAVEVPPHSSCDSMGTFQAFEIDVRDGRVLQRYGQTEAKRMYADALGYELQQADDSCVRNPKHCRVAR